MRIRSLRESRGLKQNELANDLCIGQSTLSQYESGKREPDYNTLKRIADYFDVSTDYLLGYDTPNTPTGKGIWINVLGNIAAGIPLEAIEDIVDQEEISLEMAARGEHFGLRIKGDSMEPRIKEGDVVIVRRQEDADSNDVCAILVNGHDATVKRIKKQPEGLLLIPFNPAHETTFYSNEDIAALPVMLLGKVVELRGKF